jgi:RNA polymerase sigma-70 factor (ECF subfamily)
MKSADERPDLRALYERYGHSVFRRCLYFLRTEDDARDAMHEVFLKVVTSYDEFRGQSSPLTWLVRIATHHCLNVIRGRKAGWHERYATAVHVGAQAPEPGQQTFERSELVHRLLKKLGRDEQEAAIYYFVDEMSQDEAAKACDCSVPTLRKRLRRFIEVARKELKRDDASLVFGEAPL